MTIFELGYWQFVFWWLALGVVGAWFWVQFAEERYKLWHDEHLKWWLWHWWTGGDLETEKSMRHEGPLDAYLVQRACLGAVRATALAGLPACIYLSEREWQAPAGDLAVWSYGTAAGLCAASYLLVVAACRSALSKWWRRPLHQALYKLCGWDEETSPRYLAFDRTHELGLELTITCHPSVDTTEKHVAVIDERVGHKLGRDMVRTPDWIGEASELHYRQTSSIPAKVPFVSVRQLIEEAPESKVLLGIGPGDEPLWMDLDSDSPHFLISAGTGGGKSATQRAFAAQCLYKGHEVHVLDPKRLSHIWARGRANVTIESDTAAMHALFLKLEGTLEDRKRETDDLTYRDPIPTWRRQVVIIEELTVLYAELTAWWQSPAGGNHRGTPPSIHALRKILNQGRFLMMNVCAGANRFDANQTGGGAARDQYAWVGLAEHSKAAVEMVAKDAIGDVKPKTREDRRGRMQVVVGAEVTEIRRVWFEDNEKDATPRKQAQLEAWIAWLDKAHPPALHVSDCLTDSVGQPALTSAPECGPVPGLRPRSEGLDPRGAGGGPPPLDPQGGPHAATVVKSPARENAVPAAAVADSDADLITLREAAEEGVVEYGSRDPLKSLRDASQRPGFPDPKEYRGSQQGHLYSREELRRYGLSRPGAARNRKNYRPVIYAIVAGGWANVRLGAEVKIGYSTWLPKRVRQLATRMGWVVKVFDVAPPADGEELPDKAWHRRFHDQSADKDDPSCEVFIADEELVAWLNDPEDVTP